MGNENKFKGMGDEMSRAIHGSKSYTSQAFITILGYYLGFYIVGLIMNVVYLSSANQSKKLSGVSPPGRGLLVVILWIHLIIPVILILMLVGGMSLPFL